MPCIELDPITGNSKAR